LKEEQKKKLDDLGMEWTSNVIRNLRWDKTDSSRRNSINCSSERSSYENDDTKSTSATSATSTTSTSSTTTASNNNNNNNNIRGRSLDIGKERRSFSLDIVSTGKKNDGEELKKEEVRSYWPRPTWFQRYSQLKDFHSRFGHCKVPYRWEENPGLGRWVSLMRKKKKEGKLDEQKKKLLQELFFSWSLVGSRTRLGLKKENDSNINSEQRQQLGDSNDGEEDDEEEEEEESNTTATTKTFSSRKRMSGSEEDDDDDETMSSDSFDEDEEGEEQFGEVEGEQQILEDDGMNTDVSGLDLILRAAQVQQDELQAASRVS